MIKNFLYLDEDKMYSLSSQIFEGVTEYILDEKSTESEENQSQKGPVGSGRILGDILRQVGKTTEKKFLNDFSYTLFEKKLLEDQKVIEISESILVEAVRAKAEKISFIKVNAKVVFNDIRTINNTLKNFNSIGKAIAHITNQKEIDAVREQLEKAKSTTKDRNQVSKLENQFKGMTNINKLAKEKGLQQDQSFLDDLAFVLNYGFQDQLEIQMKLADSIISANLKRECLRESEDLIIKKYSRQTESNFVLFGILTQYKRDQLDDIEDRENFSSIKEALIHLVAHLSNVEAKFTGRLSHEVIVDPIALYTEL